MIKSFLLILVTISLISCQSVKDGFSLKKTNNKDEFLVEKKSPLVVPSIYGELPKPESQGTLNQDIKNEIQIKKIIDSESQKSTPTVEDQSIDTSLEKSILKKIK